MKTINSLLLAIIIGITCSSIIASIGIDGIPAIISSCSLEAFMVLTVKLTTTSTNGMDG